MERVWAWLVHAYTTAGIVLALLMVHFSYQGEVRTVLWLFLAAMVVDGTDGMLARRWRGKGRGPWMGGGRTSHIGACITYALTPRGLRLTPGSLRPEPGGAAA